MTAYHHGCTAVRRSTTGGRVVLASTYPSSYFEVNIMAVRPCTSYVLYGSTLYVACLVVATYSALL